MSMLHDLLAPSALAFQTHSLDLGDTRAKVQVITGYPPRVGPAWLARLGQMPGVVLSVHVAPTDPAALVKAVNASITEFASRLASGGPPIAQQRNQQSLEDAKELLRKIDAEHQAVGQVVVTLLVMAPDQEECSRRVRAVQAACAAASMRAYEASYRQEDGLRAAGPWGHLPAGVAKMGQRHMPAETVAAMYPFVRSGLNDGGGIVLGRDADAGIVLANRWAPPQEAGRTNGNLTVFGSPGGGKSYGVKLWLLREYALGARIIAIDPEREYGSLADRVGGVRVNVAGGHGRVNPLEVRLAPNKDDEDDAVSVRGPLAAHMQRVQTFFNLYLPSLDDIERAQLEDALLAVYRGAGVDWHTDPATVTTWPTTADLYAYVREHCSERLAVLLRGAAEGADSAMWAGQSTVSVSDADFVVLDIHDLADSSDRVKRAQYYNALGFAWDVVRQGRAEKKRTILVVDEAWLLADPQTPQALSFLRDVSKRIRKYGTPPIGGALWVITQNVVDFLAPEVARFGEAVLGNAAYKLLMRQGERDLEALDRLLQLSEAEHSLLSQAKRGEGLLVAGNQHVRLHIEASPFEHEIITGATR